MNPPPFTLTEMSTLPLRSPAISSGDKITSLADSWLIISAGVLFILTLPEPFVMYTCALDVFLVAK